MTPLIGGVSKEVWLYHVRYICKGNLPGRTFMVNEK